MKGKGRGEIMRRGQIEVENGRGSREIRGERGGKRERHSSNSEPEVRWKWNEMGKDMKVYRSVQTCGRQ